MTTKHDNLINGQWLAGNSYSPNLNPSNLADVIGEYTQEIGRASCRERV